MPTRIGDVEVLVETSLVPGSERTSGSGSPADRVVHAFDEAERAITELAARLAGTVADLGKRGTRPDGVEVQFGLKFSAQGKVIFAAASAEASLQVTLKYQPAKG